MKALRTHLRTTLALAVLGGTAVTARAQFAVTRTFAVGEAVPDAGEFLTVGDFSVGSAQIAKVGVALKIDGSPAGAGFNGDLYASLLHASGFSVLLNRPGKNTLTGLGYSDSGLDVVLRDGASDIHQYRQTLFGSDLVPVGGVVTGMWSPDGRGVDPALVVGADGRTQMLSSFAGLEAMGEWLLFVADMVGGGTHDLDRWGLEVETVGGFTGPVNLVGDSIRAVGGPRTIPNPTSFEGQIGFTGTEALTFSGNLSLHGSVGFRVENTTTFSGPVQVSGPGSTVTKSGAGTLTLGGIGSYTGGTIVQEGALRLENPIGSATGSGLVSVLAGAVLGGRGLAAGPVEILSGATLAPDRGGTPLRTGPQTWHGGGHFRMEISGASPQPGTGWSRVEIDGALQIASTVANPFHIDLLGLNANGQAGLPADFDPGQSYFWGIATAGDEVSGFAATKFAIHPGPSLGSAAGSFGMVLNGTTLGVAYTAVPEPAQAAVVGGILVLGGVGGRIWIRRRCLNRAG